MDYRGKNGKNYLHLLEICRDFKKKTLEASLFNLYELDLSRFQAKTLEASLFNLYDLDLSRFQEKNASVSVFSVIPPKLKEKNGTGRLIFCHIYERK